MGVAVGAAGVEVVPVSVGVDDLATTGVRSVEAGSNVGAPDAGVDVELGEGRGEVRVCSVVVAVTVELPSGAP